jgi:hypothetical protein
MLPFAVAGLGEDAGSVKTPTVSARHAVATDQVLRATSDSTQPPDGSAIVARRIGPVESCERRGCWFPLQARLKIARHLTLQIPSARNAMQLILNRPRSVTGGGDHQPEAR